MTNEERSAEEVKAFKVSEPVPHVCYLSSDGKHLTTWMGDKLATITSVGRAQRGFNGASLISFHAIGINGAWYHGKHNGPGMSLRIRPMKKQGNTQLAEHVERTQ